MRVISRLHPGYYPHLGYTSLRVKIYTSQRWFQYGNYTRWRRSQGPAKLLGSRYLSQTRSINTDDSTIYALSTASGRGAIAVIRISGSACLEIYQSLCPEKAIPKPRVATVRTLYRPGSTGRPDDVLDSNALLLYFPTPRSATGEDILELHVHGGPAVIKAVLAAIATNASRSSIRYAEPGEFTRRAFFNNRLDLTQVEALGDVLTAETEQQRRLSVRGTSSSLSNLYESWRSRLLYARGELEALIDFSEDQHFDESPAELYGSVAAQVEALRKILQIHSQNAVRGELLRNGISISLLGAPNAGKSSLLNRIVGREAAIVSNEAGTTRDVVEVGLDIGGYFCRVGDTAGLRTALKQVLKTPLSNDTDDVSKSQQVISKIEEEGMRRAKLRAEESDVVIVVLSFEPRNNSTNEINNNDDIVLRIDPEVQASANRLIREKNNVIVVINKADLPRHPRAWDAAMQEVLAAFSGLKEDGIYLISCVISPEKDVGFKVPASLQDPSVTARARGARPHLVDPSDLFDGQRVQGADADDPSGVQALLQGLTRKFAKLTDALTDADHVGAESLTSISEEVEANNAESPRDAMAAAPPPTSMSGQGFTTALSKPGIVAFDPASAAAALSSAATSSSDSSSSATPWEESLGASVRHRELLDECILHLTSFLSALDLQGQDWRQKDHDELQQQQRNKTTTTNPCSSPPVTRDPSSCTPPAISERSHSMVDPSPAAGAYVAKQEATPAAITFLDDLRRGTLQPRHARVPVPDRPRAGGGFDLGGHVVAVGVANDADDVNNDTWRRDPDIIIVAEHLRAAADCLARITGRGSAGDVEDVLGVVFEKFCVGK